MASVIQSLTIYQSRQDGFSELLKIRKRGFICQKTFVLKSGTQKYSEKVLFYKVHENGFFAIFKFVSNFVSEIFRKLWKLFGNINWKQEIKSHIKPTIIDDLLFTISDSGYLFIIDKNNGNIANNNTITYFGVKPATKISKYVFSLQRTFFLRVFQFIKLKYNVVCPFKKFRTHGGCKRIQTI